MTTLKHGVRVSAVWPLLAVQEINASIAFYRDRLGFDVVATADWEGALYWCRLERDGSSLMLQTGDDDEDGPAAGRGRGVTLYFLCDDVNALHEELSSRGLQLTRPADTDYGMTQLFVPEPNGYVVCFESPTSTARG